jgi:hypothetical protein
VAKVAVPLFWTYKFSKLMVCSGIISHISNRKIGRVRSKLI